MFERTRFTIDRIDPELFAAIEKENRRQKGHIDLIALAILYTEATPIPTFSATASFVNPSASSCRT
ncbi:MAG: hypothetical protein PHD01_16915 [Geobacteraceae bacterium]|nr:hypothetical protein [Geobacteraceae bacterium]